MDTGTIQRRRSLAAQNIASLKRQKAEREAAGTPPPPIQGVCLGGHLHHLKPEPLKSSVESLLPK